MGKMKRVVIYMEPSMIERIDLQVAAQAESEATRGRLVRAVVRQWLDHVQPVAK